MKKGYLYVIVGLVAMWLQYFLIVMNEWRDWPYRVYPEDPIFWPLTITLWVVVFTLIYYISEWRG